MDYRKKIGNDGELIVARILEKRGFTIEQKNYRKPFGEIDLIARKKDLIAFVEVKRRQKKSFDLGQLITKSKQKKIIMVAQEYIARHNHDKIFCRFDIALLDGNEFTYIEDAFTD